MHDHPPPDVLTPYVESRQIPENIDIVADSPEEKALRAAFYAKRYLDLITAGWPWP